MLFAALDSTFTGVGQVLTEVLSPLMWANALVALVDKPIAFLREPVPIVCLLITFVGTPVTLVGTQQPGCVVDGAQQPDDMRRRITPSA